MSLWTQLQLAVFAFFFKTPLRWNFSITGKEKVLKGVLNTMVPVCSPELNDFFIKVERAKTKEWPTWIPRSHSGAQQLRGEVGREAEHISYKHKSKQYVKPRKILVERSSKTWQPELDRRHREEGDPSHKYAPLSGTWELKFERKILNVRQEKMYMRVGSREQ